MVDVRPATPDEYTRVRAILEGALLAVDSGALRRGAVLVAVEGGRIVGALVLSGAEIGAVAVRPRRRGGGIGTALVVAAFGRRPRLEAAFEPDVAPFYRSLGFEIAPDGERCRGRLRSPPTRTGPTDT